MKEKWTQLIGSVQDSATNLVARVDHACGQATDTVLNTVDQGVSIVKKAYAQVVGLVATLATAGIAVAMIAAPVPTVIALALMWLMEESIKESLNQIDQETEGRQDARTRDRMIKTLKRYGTIPVSSTVETDNISITINADTNHIDGIIKTGKYKGEMLSNIPLDELNKFIDTAPDQDTKDLLQAYENIQRKFNLSNHISSS